MANITPAMIKELRESTGAGMMDCKKALTENDGDVEAASDWLRKKGLASAAKKSGRVAAEGLVAVYSEGTKGAVVEVNSETDFVARNEQFQSLVEEVAKLSMDSDGVIDHLKTAKTATGKTVEETITEAIATIGENMNLRRTATLSVDNGVVASYVHNAVKPGMGKIGVLVALESQGDADKLDAFGKQIAMHVAAARPEALNREGVSADALERERQVLIDQAVASGKPQEIAEKMVEGRIRKYYEEICLVEQTFVIDGKATVQEATDAFAQELGSDVAITGYIRFECGEGVEKKEDDFAAEVAAAAGAA